MQILITMKNDGVIAVPVNYNNYVQAAVFSLLSAGDAEYTADLHDTAYGGKNKYCTGGGGRGCDARQL